MRNSLYAVLRWLDDKDGGELSLDLIGTHLTKNEAEQAIRDDQKEQAKNLNKNDPEFTESECFGLVYQYDSSHDQYWIVAEINASTLDLWEYQWLCDFAYAAFFDQPTDRNHLLSLWTAYCLHCNLDVDTKIYDAMAVFLWSVVNTNNTGPWENFDSFDNFLCQFLV